MMSILKGKAMELLETSTYAMIITMPGYDAICIGCNKKYEELIGYSREELINKSTHHLVSHDEIKDTFTKHDLLDGRIALWDKLPLIKKNGKIVIVMASTIPIFDEQNGLFAYAHIVKDMITPYQGDSEQKKNYSMFFCTNCPASYPAEYQKCPSCGT